MSPNSKESNILQSYVFNHDPHVAQKTEETLLSEFISLQQSVFRAPSTSFLEGQLEAARSHSQSENEALRTFKIAHQLLLHPR